MQGTDEFDEMWSNLVWAPIAEYDREAGQVVLLRDGDDWALGVWGEPAEYAADPQGNATWRDAQESQDEAPLHFDPTEFAPVSDDWRVHLMAD